MNKNFKGFVMSQIIAKKQHLHAGVDADLAKAIVLAEANEKFKDGVPEDVVNADRPEPFVATFVQDDAINVEEYPLEMVIDLDKCVLCRRGNRQTTSFVTSTDNLKGGTKLVTTIMVYWTYDKSTKGLRINSAFPYDAEKTAEGGYRDLEPWKAKYSTTTYAQQEARFVEYGYVLGLDPMEYASQVRRPFTGDPAKKQPNGCMGLLDVPEFKLGLYPTPPTQA
jgi:hypothetical protein